MGLVFLGLGAAGIFHTAGAPTLAALAMVAALLHVLNHAGFKALLFTAAGSVLRATGTRDLDALGGLRSRMPATTALFAVGALGAAALPPGNGFVSEWLLLQSLVHALPAGGMVTAVAMPLAVAVVALTAGLAVATFVKALGVGFFARPRSDAAASATESPPVMLAAMGVLAVGCTGLALAPAALGPVLSRAAGTAVHAPATVVGGGVTLHLAGIASTMSPLLMAVAAASVKASTAVLVRLVTLRVTRRRGVALWDCGAGPPTARMQYTATSFAEPLQRVFDDVLAPETDVYVTPHDESQYLVARVAYQQRVPDRVEHALYAPAIAAARGPLLVGVMRQVRARLEGRAGAGVIQPWRDLRKLLRRQPATPTGTGWAFRLAPLLLAGTSLVLATVVPLLTTASPLDPAADLFAVVGLLALGTVTLALGALDTGTAFGGMGASREITILALVEPTILVAVFAL